MERRNEFTSSCTKYGQVGRREPSKTCLSHLGDSVKKLIKWAINEAKVTLSESTTENADDYMQQYWERMKEDHCTIINLRNGKAPEQVQEAIGRELEEKRNEALMVKEAFVKEQNEKELQSVKEEIELPKVPDEVKEVIPSENNDDNT